MFSQLLKFCRIFERLAKALIRLRVCAGWFEPLLVAHTPLLEMSCRGLNFIGGFCGYVISRGSYRNAHVLLSLLKVLGKRDKM